MAHSEHNLSKFKILMPMDADKNKQNSAFKVPRFECQFLNGQIPHAARQ